MKNKKDGNNNIFKLQISLDLDTQFIGVDACVNRVSEISI